MRGISRTIPAIMITALLLSTGCTPEAPEERHVSATRTKTYSSQDELIKDSALIVIGVAESQTVARDLDPDLDFTITQFNVLRTIKGTPARTIMVRQTGSVAQGAPTEILTKGEEYLLYLTPSNLPGKLASQYYVTGLNAGIYQKQDPSAADRTSQSNLDSDVIYTRADPDPADHLPMSIDDEGNSEEA